MVFPSYLSFDGHALSGKLIELALVAFQDVHLVSAGKRKVRPLLDTFASTLCRCFTLHHVMGAAHGIGHRPGYGLAGLGERRSNKEYGGKTYSRDLQTHQSSP